MSNYTQTTFFTPKDSLPVSSPAKTIFGAAYDVEFGNISTAIASKPDATTVASFLNVNVTGSAVPTNGIYLPGTNILGFTTAGNQVGTVDATGHWTINTPASGTSAAFTVNGLNGASTFAMLVQAGAGAGGANGLAINAGTNQSDFAFTIANQAASTATLHVLGSSNYASPSGSQITGHITRTDDDSIPSLWEMGYMDLPSRVISSSGSLRLADRGKFIYLNGASIALNIPANSAVAFPIGTTITIYSAGNSGCTITITTDTLEWLPSGLTSTRSISSTGLATIMKTDANHWVITGVGLT